MHLIPQKPIKVQTIANFLAKHPITKCSKLYEGIPYETVEVSTALKEDVPNKIAEANVSQNEFWQLFFDSVSRMRPKGKLVFRVGIVFVSLRNHIIPQLY